MECNHPEKKLDMNTGVESCLLCGKELNINYDRIPCVICGVPMTKIRDQDNDGYNSYRCPFHPNVYSDFRDEISTLKPDSAGPEHSYIAVGDDDDE